MTVETAGSAGESATWKECETGLRGNGFTGVPALRAPVEMVHRGNESRGTRGNVLPDAQNGRTWKCFLPEGHTSVRIPSTCTRKGTRGNENTRITVEMKRSPGIRGKICARGFKHERVVREKENSLVNPLNNLAAGFQTSPRKHLHATFGCPWKEFTPSGTRGNVGCAGRPWKSVRFPRRTCISTGAL